MSSNHDHIFSNTRPDLGVDGQAYGIDKQTVDKIMLDGQTPSTHICIICKNTPHYRIIAKTVQYATAEIADRGYICNHCVQQKYLDPNLYGLRQLK